MIMDKQFGMEKELIDKISNELQTFYFVGFAIVFGSVGEGRATNISDVDIGVYVKEDVPLTSLGLLSARCETVSGRKVDLVILNNLYKKKPVLAYEIAAKGYLLFSRDRNDYVEFKKNTFLYYLDTMPLRNEVDKSFMKRLNSGKFGKRNYA
jgi:predicted nucleotidyltransferase